MQDSGPIRDVATPPPRRGAPTTPSRAWRGKRDAGSCFSYEATLSSLIALLPGTSTSSVVSGPQSAADARESGGRQPVAGSRPRPAAVFANLRTGRRTRRSIAGIQHRSAASDRRASEADTAQRLDPRRSPSHRTRWSDRRSTGRCLPAWRGGPVRSPGRLRPEGPRRSAGGRRRSRSARGPRRRRWR